MSDEYDEDENFNLRDDADLDRDDDDLDDGGDELETAVAVCEYLARSIVSDADSVEVEVVGSGRRTELQVSVADGDMGRVIGRRGRVAKAIRSVVRAAAERDGGEVDVEFMD